VLTLLRLALRDLGHQRAFSIFFVVNLALGLSGALLLDSLQGSVGRTLEGRSRAMLGADIRVSSPRALAPEEIARMDAAAGARASADVVQMFSMVSGPARARLVELRGIDESFPLHGVLVLASGGTVDASMRRRLDSEGEAWADPSLLDQLGIALGDTVKIGTGTFRLTDTIVRDTGLSMRAASLAPRLYVSLERVRATGLIQTGSRVEHQHLVAVAEDADVAVAASSMTRALGDPRVRITSHADAVTEISGAYTRVTKYLGLVSLVALALAGVASAYLFHAFLRRRVADLAILMSLGARRRRAQLLMLIEVSMLAGLSAVVAVAVVSLMLPGAAHVLSDVLPAELLLGVSLGEAASALAIALLVGPVSCLPLLVRVGTLRVAELFQEQARLGLGRGPRDALWAIPAGFVFLGLAIWRVGDVEQGAWFAGVLFAAFAVAVAAGRMVLPLVVRAGDRSRVSIRLALRQLSPQRRGSRTAFTALTLTALLLGLPPQLRELLVQQLDPPGEESVPSLFLFDIQPEQTEPLHEHLQAAGTDWQRLAPMVRARLVSINERNVAAAADADGSDGEKRRENTPAASDGRRDGLNGGLRDAERLAARHYNLTWQSELHTTETMVSGTPFSGTWHSSLNGSLNGSSNASPNGSSNGSPNGSPNELPQISIEKDFARRLGLVLGDRLRFDVQGVMVDGRIVNLREVDWTSLQPNFFVSFQPGVLEDAPSVFLASVPALDRESREKLQASIVDKFPNISMIDVTRGVERALGLLAQLRWAVAATAWTALAVGLVLVFAIARDEADERRWDINLMKVLGARHALLRTSVTVEFAALAAVATLVGCAIGVACCAALASAVLDVSWSPAWPPLLAITIVLPSLAAVTARFAMRPVLREKPQL